MKFRAWTGFLLAATLLPAASASAGGSDDDAVQLKLKAKG